MQIASPLQPWSQITLPWEIETIISSLLLVGIYSLNLSRYVENPIEDTIVDSWNTKMYFHMRGHTFLIEYSTNELASFMWIHFNI